MRLPAARLVPGVVLAVGLVTTGVLYASIVSGAQQRRQKEFQGEVARIDGAVDEAVARQVAVLHATAGALAADPGMDQRRFEIFYEHLIRGKEARITAAIGVSLWRPWAQRMELAAEAERRGVRQYRLRPASPRPEAHAVMLIAPLDADNAPAPGFDMHADGVRRSAMDQARSSGSAVMTSRVFLAKDRGSHRPAVLLYLPVTDPSTGRFMGFVFSGLRTEELFEDLFTSEGEAMGEHVGLRIWSGDRSDSDRVYARSLGEPVAFQRSASLPLRAAQGRLFTEILLSNDFGTQGSVRRYVLPVGTAISLLLFSFAMSLRRSHEATERRETEQTLLAEIGRLTVRPDDSDAVLREIAEATASTLEAACRIDLIESDGSLRTIDTRTQGEEARRNLEREYPRIEHDLLFRRALETGESQRANGYVTVDEAHRQLIEPLNVSALLIVPFWLGDRSLGAMTFVRAQGQPVFSAEASALAEAIAGRLALSIDNVRLYRDLERRVEERTRDLEASNHELESFCYSVSHDLRTPLRSLDGFGRALREDYGDRLDEQGLDYIDRIRAATKRMDELITALLTLSRLTRREIVPIAVDVTSLVKDQMSDLDPEGKIALDVEEGLTVNADSRMMAVLFDNLLSNAVKFTSRKDRPRIWVGREADGAIYVRDNGAGFDLAYANKLFQPFERLHSVREFPGHGIGLATVERIVRRHGGEVRAHGQPGEGATFAFRLPG